MHNDGDTLEDYYKRAHLDETRRKFLDGLKEENSAVMKKQVNWAIELVKKHKIRPYSSLHI
jgi:L-ribulose-5-phosphate 3-epimerase UlaE